VHTHTRMHTPAVRGLTGTARSAAPGTAPGPAALLPPLWAPDSAPGVTGASPLGCSRLHTTARGNSWRVRGLAYGAESSYPYLYLLGSCPCPLEPKQTQNTVFSVLYRGTDMLVALSSVCCPQGRVSSEDGRPPTLRPEARAAWTGTTRAGPDHRRYVSWAVLGVLDSPRQAPGSHTAFRIHLSITSFFYG